jgi:hypothetical protein
MRRRLLVCVGLMGTLGILLSCGVAPVVTVNVLKPASLHLPGIKKIAIADLQGPNRSGTQIATLAQSMIMQTGHFDVMERDKLRRVLEEQNLGMAGIVDASTAAEIGKLLGVQALIFGEVATYEIEPDKEITRMVKQRRGTGKYHDVEEKDKKTGKMKKVKKEITEEVWVPRKRWVRKGTVAINFRVVDVETGRLLAAHSDSKSYDSEKEKTSFLQRYSDKQNLKPEGEILADLSKAICEKFARMVAPYYSEESRKLESGKGSIKVGVKYATAGLWPEAIEAWKQAVLEMPEEPAAYYNLGLGMEIQGDLDRAEALYQAAIKLKQKDLYMKAVAHVRQAREEQKKLQEQLGGEEER